MAIPEGYEAVASSVPDGYEAVDAPPNDNIEYLKKVGRSVNAIGEAAANTAVGLGATVVGTPLSLLHELHKKIQGDTDDEGDSLGNFVSKFTHPLHEESSALGKEYTDKVNEAIQAFGIPMAGLHLSPVLNARFSRRSRIPGKFDDNIPMPKGTPEPPPSNIPPGYEAVLDKAYQKAPEADAAQVASLEAALARRGEPQGQGTIAVDTTGNAMSPAQSAQRAIDARQGALEQQMRQSQGLDFNAAERARQENAPTGYAEYQEQLRQAAEQRQPGDNTPLNMPKRGGTYPVDATAFPQVLQDAPYQHQGTLDFTDHTADVMSKPLEQDINTPKTPADVSAWEGEGGNTAVSSYGKPNPAAAYWANRQRGAIDMEAFRNQRDLEELKKLLPEVIEDHTPQIPGLDVIEGEPRPQPKLSVVPKGQRGAIDEDLLGIGRLHDKLKATVDKLGEAKVSPYTPAEKIVVDALGQRTFIPKGDAPASIIQNALSEGKDGEALANNWQSGLTNASEKVKSAAMLGVARWLNFGKKMGDRYYRENVRPVEQIFSRLSTKDLIQGQTLLRNEMMARTQYGPEELAHLSPKAREAHAALRDVFDKALAVTNDGLIKLGKEPLRGEDAYMASMWNGNYHMPIFEKAGLRTNADGTPSGPKLAWYVKVETLGEAKKALDYLKNDPELGKTLDLDNTKIAYHPVNVGSRVPRDVMGAYQDMLQYFEGDTAQHMKAAMEQYTAEKGYTFQQFQKHFENKANIRGFQGDRPWLSDEANATAQAKAQFQYLRDAFHWAPMQEALANVKEVIASPELNKQQPNNMALTKNYTAYAMGVSKNMFRAVEQELQHTMTSLPVPWIAQNSQIARFVHSLKTFTYLQQLGLSAGYMIATPLQSFLLGPAWHMKLSAEGITHNVLKTATQALMDFSTGIIGHEAKNITGRDVVPMSEVGQRAFDYMEDNGIISQNIFHENAGFGDYKPVHVAKSVIGWTISMPEKIARSATFMSFVHHLHDSNVFHQFNADGTRYVEWPKLFQRAEELTNHVLTDFNRESRPLLVDKWGQAGELGYTYKSAIFNQWNSLGIFARDAMKGKPGPLLAALFGSAVMGGTLGVAGINELDAGWNFVKDHVSTMWPSMYPKISGVGVKGFFIKHMNEFAANKKVQDVIGQGTSKFVANTANYGLPSAVMNSQLASRFSSSLGDPGSPLSNLAPAVQELKEWTGLGKAVVNPTSTNIAEGIHKNMPSAIQGNMETNMDAFKTTKQRGGQGYANTNDLEKHETTYVRTPDDEMKRRFGLRSLDEATTKSDRYINNQESIRLHNAQQASMDKMFDAFKRGDKSDVKAYARAYFDNNGAENFEKDLTTRFDKYMFTPEQRAILRMDTIGSVKNVQRYRQLHLGK